MWLGTSVTAVSDLGLSNLNGNSLQKADCYAKILAS